jgi:hypothetical protein
VCFVKIRQAVVEEIDAAKAAHEDQGGVVAFLTLTIPHRRRDPLGTLLDALLGTWSHLIGGRRGQRLRALGVEGFVRIVDYTHTDAGHHPHLHVAVFLRGLREGEDVIDLLQPLDRLIRDAWHDRLVALGYRRPPRQEGVRLIPFNRNDSAGAYLAKVGAVDQAGLELARGDLKRGRRSGSRTIWQVMGDHMRDGEASDFRVLEEYVLTMKGRRLVSWSRDVRRRLGLGRECTDEELAAETDPAEDQVLVADPLWREIDARRLTVAVPLAGEARGVRGVVDLLAAAGVGVVVDVDRDGRGPPRLVWAPRGAWDDADDFDKEDA